MNHTTNILTGGNGITGQTGQNVIDAVNVQFDAIMGVKEYIPSNFTWSTANLSTFTGKTLVIKDNHTATATFTFPADVILLFEGGRLTITGTITGNRTKVINPSGMQIFSTLSTFAGTWIEVVATPQWFGGYPSINPTITEAQGAIDIKPIIDKILASPFGLHFPVGAYYRKGAVNRITKPIVITFGGDNLEQSFLPTSLFDLSSATYQANHVRFYTDDNNPFFEYAMTGVVMEGFTCDVALCSNYDNPILFSHADTQTNGLRIRATLIDTTAHCRAALPDTNTGVKGFEFKVAGSTIDYGSICNLHLNINTKNIAYPVIFNEVSTSGRLYTWITTNFISGTWVGYKKFYLCGMSGSKHRITLQTAYTLTLAERDTLYSGYVGQCELDLVPWDLTGTKHYTEDYYYNKLGVVLGANVALVGNGLVWYQYGAFSGELPVPTRHINNYSDIVLLRDRWSVDDDSFNSQLDSNLIGFVEYGGSYSVTAYSGAAIDFDANLVEGTETPTANILIESSANLMSYSKPLDRENNPTRWTFLAGSDLDKDFVEVVLDATSYNFTSNRFFIHLFNGSTKCKRVQVIATSAITHAKTVYEGRIPSVTGKQILPFTVDMSLEKLVIRFIGSTNTTGTLYILDLASQNDHKNNLVYRYEQCTKYRAYLTQTGVTAPTAVLDRTNSIVTTLNYISPGTYTIYKQYAFPLAKSFPHKAERIDRTTGNIFILTRINDDSYRVETLNSSGVHVDAILTDELVEIEVSI